MRKTCWNLVKSTLIFYVIVPRSWWCDCDVIENLPNINDGEYDEEEAESPHQGNCCILV